MGFALNFLLGKYCYRSLQVIDLCKGALKMKHKADLTKREKNYAHDNDFAQRSALTFC